MALASIFPTTLSKLSTLPSFTKLGTNDLSDSCACSIEARHIAIIVDLIVLILSVFWVTIALVVFMIFGFIDLLFLTIFAHNKTTVQTATGIQAQHLGSHRGIYFYIGAFLYIICLGP